MDEMEKFKKELRRAGCVACGCYGVHLHHIKTVGSGGRDLVHNLIPLCFRHHDEIHRSWSKFLIKYIHVNEYLENLGWKIIDGRLRHDDN